jgi:hypothetical protein
VRSEDTEFLGGPLDGRVLPVLVGIMGNPPKTYTVPVPDPEGGEPAVYVYHRALNPDPARRRHARWRYEYDPLARPEKPRWPWSRR